MKLWLAYILMLLFSFQALPVRELGKLLGKKAIQEQVQDESGDASDTSKQLGEKELEKLFVSTPALQLSPLVLEEQVKVALHRLHLFEDHFHPDVTTPPPDAARC